MPRPRKFRRVCCMPVTECFGPIGIGKGYPKASGEVSASCGSSESVCEAVQMSVDEYETIRLMDLEGLTQEECSLQMGIARSTVQGIYNDARKKLAEALVYGKLLNITGGDYTLCEHFERECGKGCRNKCHKK